MLAKWPRRLRRMVSLFLVTACAPASLAAADDAPQRIRLWPDTAPVGDGVPREKSENATITVYRPAPDKANGAAVVICPGGGYAVLVDAPEGRGIAEWLNAHGITGIVLHYRLPAGRPFVPLLDAQRAIRMVRASADEWKIDPHRLGIIGFSAGGHLASTAATHFDAGDSSATDPIEQQSCRPDFAILVYPVVTMSDDKTTHQGSKHNLLGANPKPELVELFSNEKQVTDKTPPIFMAHAKDDTPVPPENSQRLHEALKSHHVASEFLELPSGGHGLNGYSGPMWNAWQTRSLEWLAEQHMLGK
jgi:acetyl esterase/lipase